MIPADDVEDDPTPDIWMVLRGPKPSGSAEASTRLVKTVQPVPPSPPKTKHPNLVVVVENLDHERTGEAPKKVEKPKISLVLATASSSPLAVTKNLPKKHPD